MQVEIRRLDGDELEFLLADSNPAFANSVRRTAIREVPTMAVEEVEFKANDSAMYDEIIAHRLAMMPLRTPLKGYALPGACGCREGRCAKCSVELAIKAEGPTTAISGSMKSSDEDVVPVNGSIPIVKLERGQVLELTAIARLGLGSEHAKWQPGIIAYKYVPVLEFDAKLCDGCGECVKACPKQVLEVTDGKVKVTDLTACIMCKACAEVCPRKAAKVSSDPTKFVFRIESSGSLPPEQIVFSAVKVLEGKVEEFNKLLKKL